MWVARLAQLDYCRYIIIGLWISANVAISSAGIQHVDTNLILDTSESTSWIFGVKSTTPGSSSSFWYTSTISLSNWGGSLASITLIVMLTESEGGSGDVPVPTVDLSLQTNKSSSFFTPICRVVKVVFSKSFPWKKHTSLGQYWCSCCSW